MRSVFKKYMWCSTCSKEAEIDDTDHIHDYFIESDDVLTALFELRGLIRREAKEELVLKGTEPTLTRLLDPQEVATFWKQFERIFPANQEQLWIGLEHGLKQYLQVLKEREELFEECEQMRNQNKELSRLLSNF